MPSSERTALGIQHAWRLMSDGMNIHRWYLSADRRLTDLVRRRYAAFDHHKLPPLDVLLSKWSRGPLLQLLRSAHDSGELLTWVQEPMSTDDPPCVCLGGCWSSCGELLLSPEEVTRPIDTPDVVRRAMQFLVAAGLGSLCEIAIDILAMMDYVPARGTSWRAGNSCVPVRAAAGGPEIAAQMASGASLQLFAGFVQSYDAASAQHFGEATETSTAYALAAEALETAVSHRVLMEINDDSFDPPLDRSEAASVADLLGSQIASIERLAPSVYGLENDIELTCFELVNVSFPGPRQYEKYAAGTGVGQG